MTLNRLRACSAAFTTAAVLGAATVVASPFQVDSTGTAEGIEVKSAFEYRDAPDRQTLIAPKIAVAFPLASDLEIEFGTGYRRTESDGARRSGLSDSSIELKWRLLDEGPAPVAVAIIPELSVPTGSQRRGLGSGHTALIVPVVIEKHVGPVLLAGLFGYARSFGGDERFFPVGVLATMRAREGLKVGVELAGEAPADRFSDCELNANIGFKWQATPSMEIHGLAGRTVRSPGADSTTRFKLVAELHL